MWWPGPGAHGAAEPCHRGDVHLVAREGAEIVYVYKVESIHGAIRMVSRIGMRRPLYCTGVGKAILATRGDEEVLQCWEESERVPCTPYTITRKDAFLREIARSGSRAMRWTTKRTSWGCAAQRRPSRTGTGLRPMPCPSRLRCPA